MIVKKYSLCYNYRQRISLFGKEEKYVSVMGKNI